ncbi:cellulose biosynthesis cyclic di-GMP-binding regulatory protein BcsB [Noviherbaspirillum malthae]|uniref:cellulose biosynthesis cyclic di-GMP-binding regulatory protein BcsB n=1 Tax=Noviherbaspirillum malthae TaxID=1260987 RepID=UPI00188FD631|nr:cellulose biosynthesis cyclic di-GMP-binding regulatory protein BcsB [Noviherbaspirillum malthae]
MKNTSCPMAQPHGHPPSRPRGENGEPLMSRVPFARKMIAFSLATALLPSVGNVGAAPAKPADDGVPAAAPADAPLPVIDPASLPVDVRKVTLGKLTNTNVFKLRTTEGRAVINFGLRADELVTKATLRLRYSYSPALIASQSHLKVVLNDEVIKTLPITKEDAGKPLVQDVELDPRFITSSNNLTLVFVGHYANECEDPLHTSLWADVSGSSELQLTVRPVVLKSDLATLPEPFFDGRDNARLRLSYVFAAKPSYETLRAAGITSSWFGKLARWRGARFPAHLDTAPKGHAVVFATNTERPGFLSRLEPFTAPGISVITNPGDGFSKLLLISGRDGNDLKTAATSLVLGNAAVSGTHVAVKQSREEAPRKAYDAPNWVRLDRPMKFGELIEYQQQLQVFGHVPDPIRIDLRMPPDLFTWKSRGIPVDLKYRYTPPIRASESRMSMGINEELVQAVNLRSAGQNDGFIRVPLPLLDGGMLGEQKDMLIPPFKLGSRNQLQYAFSFTYHKEGACRDTQVENVRAMVDSDSTIDFSGFPHYAEMPNLGYFSTAGFPFTKYADLAQTAVVMPENAGAQDIEVMLTLLGRMGESTGYPATRLTVTGPKDEGALKDKDLLLIGTAPGQGLLAKWGEKLPAIISGPNRRISQPERSVNFLYDWLGFGTRPNPDVATQEHIQGDGPLAALLGFESPLSSGRSVVAVTAVESRDLTRVLDVLENDGIARSMHGSATFVRGDKAESVLAGDTYTIGTLPFWTVIWYPITQRPILMMALMLAALVASVFGFWKLLKLLTTRRPKGEE